MAMKLSRMVTYLEGLLIVKLCSALIRWQSHVANKNHIYYQNAYGYQFR